MRKLILLLVFVALPQMALGGTTSSVSSPTVTKGKTKVETRIGYSEDDKGSSSDERLRTQIYVDHGFTDVFAARITADQDKRKGDNYEHDSVDLMARFHILNKDEYGFDFGSRVQYTIKDGDKKPDSVKLGLYEMVPYGDYQFRFNQRVSHEVGEDSHGGLEAELRMQGTKKIGDYRLGLEGFHDFGKLNKLSGYSNQEHEIGPVLKGKLPYNFSFETGYRAGISKAAPNHNFKFFISRSF